MAEWHWRQPASLKARSARCSEVCSRYAALASELAERYVVPNRVTHMARLTLAVQYITRRDAPRLLLRPRAKQAGWRGACAEAASAGAGEWCRRSILVKRTGENR